MHSLLPQLKWKDKVSWIMISLCAIAIVFVVYMIATTIQREYSDAQIRLMTNDQLIYLIEHPEVTEKDRDELQEEFERRDHE